MDLSCSINHPGIKLGRPHISLHCWTGHVRARLVRATNCQFKYRTLKQVQKYTCLADDNITTTKFSFQHFEEKSTELSFLYERSNCSAASKNSTSLGRKSSKNVHKISRFLCPCSITNYVFTYSNKKG
jgi:hypothetical protein